MRLFLTFSALLLLSAPALADHHEGGGEAAAMPEMGRPAEMDKIAFMVGEWDVAMKYKMDPMGEEWTETTGSATVTPVLDGCAQRMDFEADIMGMPFTGFDHTTWNREEGRFESVWLDNMSAKFSKMSGNFEGDKLVMQGPDKMQGMEFLSRAVSEREGDDILHWTMYMSMDDGETWVENMQMTYTRKQ